MRKHGQARAGSIAFAGALLSFAATLEAQTAKVAMRTPACTAGQISLTFDAENGNFDATSHAGLLVVIRNYGIAACSVALKPQFSFADAAHHDLPLRWRAPVGMHPGPVLIPVVVPAGAEVTAGMQWVSGPVFEKSTCLDAASVSLPLDGGTVTATFSGHLCGQAGKPLTYDLQPLRRDPVYAAAKP